MKTTKRNEYLDILKGLLITLVVIGHLPFFEYDSRTLTLIYGFHMPAFLIIGGYLSHIDSNSTYSGILTRRFNSTLVPYFVFYFISLLLVPTENSFRWSNAIITIFNGIGHPDKAINLPLWFLTFYFVALTLYEFIECTIYKICKKINAFSIMLPVFITCTLIVLLSFYYAKVLRCERLPFNFEIAAFSLLFVFFGKFLSLTVKDAYEYIKKNTNFMVFSIIISLFILGILSVCYYFFTMKNGRIDLNARDYKIPFLMYFDAIIGFIIFSYFSLIVSIIPIIKNIFSYLGKNSLYILAYHVPSTIVTYNVIIPLFPPAIGSTIYHNSIFSILFLTTCGILFSLFMSLIHKSLNFPIKHTDK